MTKPMPAKRGTTINKSLSISSRNRHQHHHSADGNRSRHFRCCSHRCSVTSDRSRHTRCRHHCRRARCDRNHSSPRRHRRSVRSERRALTCFRKRWRTTTTMMTLRLLSTTMRWRSRRRCSEVHEGRGKHLRTCVIAHKQSPSGFHDATHAHAQYRRRYTPLSPQTRTCTRAHMHAHAHVHSMYAPHARTAYTRVRYTTTFSHSYH
jgi:hypothetical protein